MSVQTEMAIKWTHITIGTSDFDRSIAFYRDFCNLKVVRDRRRKEGGGTVWLGSQNDSPDNPSFVLVLMRSTTISPVDHLGFECGSKEEVESIARRAEKEGILENPPTDSGGVVGYWTIVKDPDGHFVEFTYGQPIKGLI